MDYHDQATEFTALSNATNWMRRELNELAAEFDGMDRIGDRGDEPEGSRYVQMSDTLAKQIASKLREIAR